VRVAGSGQLFFILFALVFVSACSEAQTKGQAAGKAPAARTVSAAPVIEESVRRSLDVVATLAAADEVIVSSEADGVVRRIAADLGDRVTEGQVLVELDREKSAYGFDQQKAALARALARYGGTDLDHLPPVEQTPDVQRAAAELDQAKQSEKRAVELHKRQLVPSQMRDDAEATRRAKQAEYDSAVQNVKNLRADIDAANATMKLAERQLRDTSIRAPFDGYIQKRTVSLGELVKAQTPVMTVVRVSPLKAKAEIPERMAPWIKIGQPLSLLVDAFPGRTFDATLSRISPAVNTQTRTFAFEATAPNQDAVLKPGTFARAHLETALVEHVLTIPYAAMQYRYGVNRAFVVKGDALAVRELALGDRHGERMEVTNGLKAGELVVTTDVDNLTDGMKVVVGEPKSK
jgi:RND family efflux transporter MFP subunit